MTPLDIKELTAIRKLLAKGLLNARLLTQQEVANILGVDRSTVSRELSVPKDKYQIPDPPDDTDR